MSLPTIVTASDITGNEGKLVSVRGKYGVQDLGGYAVKVKSSDGWIRVQKIAHIKLMDESYINLPNRPDDEMNALNGCRVSATGKLLIPADPRSQPVMAKPDPLPTLDEISLIEAEVNDERP